MIDSNDLKDVVIDRMALVLGGRGLVLAEEQRGDSFGDRLLRFRAPWGFVECIRDRGVGSLTVGREGWSAPVDVPVWAALLEGGTSDKWAVGGPVDVPVVYARRKVAKPC